MRVLEEPTARSNSSGLEFAFARDAPGTRLGGIATGPILGFALDRHAPLCGIVFFFALWSFMFSLFGSGLFFCPAGHFFVCPAVAPQGLPVTVRLMTGNIVGLPTDDKGFLKPPRAVPPAAFAL